MKLKNEIKLVSIRIERSDCDITNYIYKNYKNTNIERLKIDGKTTTHRIKFNSADDMHRALNDLKEISIETVKTGNNVLWSRASCCSACGILGSLNIIILGSKAINDHVIVYKLLIPDYLELKNLKNNLDNSGLKYLIEEISGDNNIKLTDRENEILLKLYKSGYFDIERKVSLTEIAKEIGISVPALSDLLRRALNKILKGYIENNLY